MWPEKKVEVVGDATSSENNVTTITSAELENKDEAAMEVFIAELNNGKEYVCKDCKSEYKKGNASYLLTMENESIIKGIKNIGDDVIEVKCAHGVTGKCTQCNPPTVLKCNHGNDKKSCNECKKKETSDNCAHGNVKKDCLTCTPKSQTGKTTVTVVIKSGDTYSKLRQSADAKCGKGKWQREDWSPKISDETKMKPGTYTCDCPK
jgi:LysM repeat protein